jgi:hypothetical protein
MQAGGSNPPPYDTQVTAFQKKEDYLPYSFYGMSEVSSSAGKSVFFAALLGYNCF